MKFVAKNADFSENSIEKVNVTLIYNEGDTLPLEWICDDEKPLAGAFINGRWLTLQTTGATNGECLAVIRGETLTPLLGKKIHVKVDYGVNMAERLVFWPSDDLKPLEEWVISTGEKIYNGTYTAIESYLTGASDTSVEGDFTVPSNAKMIIVMGYKFNSATLVKNGISVTAAEDIYG